MFLKKFTQHFSSKVALAVGLGVVAMSLFLTFWWSKMPDPIDREQLMPETYVVGYATVTALIATTETLLNKPGGYLSNDVFPISYFMDDMPAFEFGALEQTRDLALVLRKEWSRSQSQSPENKDLALAHTKLNISHTSWSFPSAEREYSGAVTAFKSYRSAIQDPEQARAQFYARADNLASWMTYVTSRLGSHSLRLAASIGTKQEHMGLVGDTSASQSTQVKSLIIEQTPWLEIDDVFYEARGSCWALLNFMYAAEIDFKNVLDKKNAHASIKQIIRELEATQTSLWSPMILNGSGFGILANHSLVMANYISRANSAVIDLQRLLANG
jgi:hypothetical protein